jgi:hypothetical protein
MTYTNTGQVLRACNRYEQINPKNIQWIVGENRLKLCIGAKQWKDRQKCDQPGLLPFGTREETWISETGDHFAMYDDQPNFFKALLTYLEAGASASAMAFVASRTLHCTRHLTELRLTLSRSGFRRMQ